MISTFDLSRLRTAIKPFRLHWFPTLRSTNDHAQVLRERGTLFAPAIVLTGRQTAGRGRGAHAWWSSAGCLTVTFVLPVDDAIAPHQVPLLAGLAVRRAACRVRLGGRESVTGASDSTDRRSAFAMASASAKADPTTTPSNLIPIQLKWPNDLLAGGRKLAGLLCERVRKVDLIGVGLNVNLDPATAPADLRGKVTSLSALAGHSFDMTDVLAAVARELLLVMQQRGEREFPAMLREYDEHHALNGRSVTVIEPGDGPPITGKVSGLDDMGRLLVRGRNELHRVIAGQIVMK